MTRAHSPAISATPDTAQVRRPAFIQRGRDGGDDPHTRPEADRMFANLPMLELENPLYRVLVEPQQMRHRAVAERWVLFDHLLDGRREAFLQRERVAIAVHDDDIAFDVTGDDFAPVVGENDPASCRGDVKEVLGKRPDHCGLLGRYHANAAMTTPRMVTIDVETSIQSREDFDSVATELPVLMEPALLWPTTTPPERACNATARCPRLLQRMATPMTIKASPAAIP